MHCLLYSSQQSCERGSSKYTPFPVRQWRLREVKQLVKGHTACKCQDLSLLPHHAGLSSSASPRWPCTHCPPCSGPLPFVLQSPAEIPAPLWARQAERSSSMNSCSSRSSNYSPFTTLYYSSCSCLFSPPPVGWHIFRRHP